MADMFDMFDVACQILQHRNRQSVFLFGCSNLFANVALKEGKSDWGSCNWAVAGKRGPESHPSVTFLLISQSFVDFTWSSSNFKTHYFSWCHVDGAGVAKDSATSSRPSAQLASGHPFACALLWGDLYASCRKVGSSGRVFFFHVFQWAMRNWEPKWTKPYVLIVVRYIHAKVFVVTIVVGNSVVPSHLVLSKFPRIV